MIEVTGNIWDYPADAICVTTNLVVKRDGNLVMGAGLAKQAKDRYPYLPQLFGAYYGQYSNLSPEEKADFEVIYFYPSTDDTPAIVSYPTKYDWRDDSDIILVVKAARSLAQTATDCEWETVVLPRPGCGLGKLKWERVKSVIEPFLDDRFHVITPK